MTRQHACQDLQDLQDELDFICCDSPRILFSACERDTLMTDVKCIRCGVLTTGITQICKVCEIELNPIRPSGATPVFVPYPTTEPGTTVGPFNTVQRRA